MLAMNGWGWQSEFRWYLHRPPPSKMASVDIMERMTKEIQIYTPGIEQMYYYDEVGINILLC